MTEDYFPITKQELSLIKNNCFHPETDSCDGCEYASMGELPCTWKGANVLEDEILSRNSIQSVREKVIGELEEKIKDNWEFIFGILPHNDSVSKPKLLKWLKELRGDETR